LSNHFRVDLPDNCQTIAWPLCPCSYEWVTGHHRHSKYRMILVIHTKSRVAYQVTSRPGDAKPLLYVISKEITKHMYSYHVFRQSVNKQVTSICTRSLFTLRRLHLKARSVCHIHQSSERVLIISSAISVVNFVICIAQGNSDE
jgi:hypothetical protein